MHKTENQNSSDKSQNKQSDDAVFIGWQPNFIGDDFPLYTITASGHPSQGSTVSKTTLNEMKLQVPETPLLNRR